MKCRQCRHVFAVIVESLNSQTETTEMLEQTAQALVEQFDLKRHHDLVRSEGISSVLLVPLICRDATLGVLSLYTNRPYRFSDEEIQMMQSIAGQCALAIRNAQMYTTLKQKYDSAATDFQVWFDRFGVYGTDRGRPMTSKKDC